MKTWFIANLCTICAYCLTIEIIMIIWNHHIRIVMMYYRKPQFIQFSLQDSYMNLKGIVQQAIKCTSIISLPTSAPSSERNETWLPSLSAPPFLCDFKIFLCKQSHSCSCSDDVCTNGCLHSRLLFCTKNHW